MPPALFADTIQADEKLGRNIPVINAALLENRYGVGQHMKGSLDALGQIGQIQSAEDAFQCEREAYERLEKDLRYHKDAIRCAYQNLERQANNINPSVLAIRAALQALKPYL